MKSINYTLAGLACIKFIEKVKISKITKVAKFTHLKVCMFNKIHPVIIFKIQ